MAPAQNQQLTRRIWYVGLKGDHPQGETAFSHLTSIVWRTGDVHDIPSGIASQMLAHPDVFSDKSPEERAALAEEARQHALQEQQAQQQAGAGLNLESLLSVLPPGASITLADGRVLSVSAAAGPAPVPGSLEGAHASSMAARLAGHTGATNEDGQPTTKLEQQVGDATGAGFGGSDQRVQETRVGGDANAQDGINLAPGAKVAPAATQAPAQAPAPTPAPKAAPAPADKHAANKAKK
jgi:hypothetical protein